MQDQRRPLQGTGESIVRHPDDAGRVLLETSKAKARIRNSQELSLLLQEVEIGKEKKYPIASLSERPYQASRGNIQLSEAMSELVLRLC